MLTTTGPGMIKCWFNGQDDCLRSGAVLPPAKEIDAFVDHVWMPQVLGGPAYKMVALTDPEALNANAPHPNTAISLTGSDGGNIVVGGSSVGSIMSPLFGGSQASVTASSNKRQTVFIFEGSEVSGASLTSITAPIALELKQVTDMAGAILVLYFPHKK